jgi:peptide/nickel transport system permease protein
MSVVPGGTVVPLITVKAPRRGRAVGLLRGTGVAGMISAGVIALATVVAVIGGLIAPFSPTAPNLALAFVGPTGGHLLGFDYEGRDVLSRLLAGAQSSMLGPLAVVVGALVIGTLLAVIAARRRGPSWTRS